MPNTSLSNGIPFQVLFKHAPDYLFLRVFVCAVYPLLRPYNRNKFSFRPKQCIFLGYSPHHIGYRCLDKDTGHIYVARHVQFDEQIFPFKALGSVPIGDHFSNMSLPRHPWLQITYLMSLPMQQIPSSI